MRRRLRKCRGLAGRPCRDAAPQPAGAPGCRLHPLLRQLVSHRPRHGVYAERLPRFSRRERDEGPLEVRAPPVDSPQPAQRRLYYGVPLRRRHQLHQHQRLPAGHRLRADLWRQGLPRRRAPHPRLGRHGQYRFRPLAQHGQGLSRGPALAHDVPHPGQPRALGRALQPAAR